MLSLVVHFASSLGLPVPAVAMGLHVGIFLVWIPAILVSIPMTRDVPHKDFWRAALRGCPKWMRIMVYVFFGYAILNFALFLCGAFQGPADATGGAPPSILKGFSGHWMAFYATALAMFYSATQVRRMKPRQCPLGHTVSLSTRYCEQCGSRVEEE